MRAIDAEIGAEEKIARASALAKSLEATNERILRELEAAKHDNQLLQQRHESLQKQWVLAQRMQQQQQASGTHSSLEQSLRQRVATLLKENAGLKARLGEHAENEKKRSKKRGHSSSSDSSSLLSMPTKKNKRKKRHGRHSPNISGFRNSSNSHQQSQRCIGANGGEAKQTKNTHDSSSSQGESKRTGKGIRKTGRYRRMLRIHER